MCGLVEMMSAIVDVDVCAILCGCLPRCEGDDGVGIVCGMG